MKKTLLLLLIVASLALSLVGCGEAERYDLLHTVELDGLTYNVRGSGFRAKQITVKKGEELLVYLNFLPVKRENFVAALPKAGKYQEVFNSDATEFGGAGNVNTGILTSKPCELLRGYEHAVTITLPPMGAVVLKKYRKSAE